MSFLYRPTVVRSGQREKSRIWWGCFRVLGEPKPRKFSTGTDDRGAAKIILKRAERDGVLHADDPFRDAKATPLVDFLPPFREHVSRRASAKQTDLAALRVRRVLEVGAFAFWHDLTADRAETAIVDLKAKQRGRNANRVAGVSARTANFHRSAVKRFAQWLCTSGRFASNPWPG